MIEQTFTWFSVKEHMPPVDKDGVELLLNIVYYEDGTRRDYVAHGITRCDGMIYSPDRGFFDSFGENHGDISHWAFFPLSPTLNPVSYIFMQANRKECESNARNKSE